MCTAANLNFFKLNVAGYLKKISLINTKPQQKYVIVMGFSYFMFSSKKYELDDLEWF